jgi:ATP-dependent Lon protease
VTTLEEEEHSQYYGKTTIEGADGERTEKFLAESSDVSLEPLAAPNVPLDTPNISLDPTKVPLDTPNVPAAPGVPAEPLVKEKHLTFQENQKGISFDTLFGPYLKGAKEIIITDPYIRLYYQIRNFMEFLETVVKNKASDEEVSVHLTTAEDEFKGHQQREHFEKIRDSAGSAGVVFTWTFVSSNSLHARHILTDQGWKISLDRGLDIFQPYEMKDAFTLANRLQQFRPCKAFEVTFIKQG